MRTQTTLMTAAATVTDVPVKAGKHLLKADGTWGGGTLTLTFAEAAGGIYAPIGSGVSLSENGSAVFDVAGGFVKAVLSDSTDATVNWALGGISGRAASDA